MTSSGGPASMRIRSLLLPHPDRVLDIVGAWTLGAGMMVAVRGIFGRPLELFTVLACCYLGVTILRRSRYALYWMRIFSGVQLIATLVGVVLVVRRDPTAVRIDVVGLLNVPRDQPMLAYLGAVVPVLIGLWTFANLIRSDVYAATTPTKRWQDDVATEVRPA
jgi:hypothetical protein